jgi:hypothetical protein
LTN